MLPLAEFAYNNSAHESTGTSPFYANYGYHPAMNGALVQGIQGESKELANHILKTQEELKSTLLLAQEKQKEFYDTYSNKVELEKGDKVWLKHENFTTTRPSQKLDYKWMGPYEIEKKHSRLAYRLKLPTMMKIYPVFNIDKLAKWKPDEIPGRPPTNPPPVIVEDQGPEWEVESVDDLRYYYNKLQYLVKWKGYGIGEDPWQPAENLSNSPQLIEEFHNVTVTDVGIRPKYMTGAYWRVVRELVGSGLVLTGTRTVSALG
jgi:hypothetical protein